MPKIDLGLVKGEKGDRGEQGSTGPRGAQGIQGEKGADATINGYNTSTLTASGNLTLTQTKGAMTLKTTPELDAAVKWACNRNLLIDWYFLNPVNQRGADEVTSAYGIDMWIGTYAIENGIRIGRDDAGYALQKLDAALKDYLDGRVVTASVMTDGGDLVSGTLTYRKSGAQRYFYSAGKPHLVLTTEGNLEIWSNEERTVVAAKLELGDRQTLAHKEGDTWVLNEAPDYGKELLKCQRYFQIFATEAERPVEAEDFRPVMRIKPTPSTVVINGKTYYTADAGI